MSVLSRAATSTAAYAALSVAFSFLFARSVSQDRWIKLLEVENKVLLAENKLMGGTKWDWKQKLYAETEENRQNAPAPISTLKSPYGEAVAAPTSAGRDDKQGGPGPEPKIMIL
ncbi:glutamine--tRNA ligase [Striga asiatica]|uniref:Glutamine--tRNA ligase n=1 Tax=Striga asiatica TaxID=4170 RepID=A0A5A7QW65_STRAF|nr:glutamine--tRNA ligase [Striga asiatica]